MSKSAQDRLVRDMLHSYAQRVEKVVPKIQSAIEEHGSRNHDQVWLLSFVSPLSPYRELVVITLKSRGTESESWEIDATNSNSFVLGSICGSESLTDKSKLDVSGEARAFLDEHFDEITKELLTETEW
jgi:hypothetical protein